MTTTLYIEQDYACPADQLAKLLADDDFDTELLEALDIKREVVEASGEGPQFTRNLRLTPSTKLPGFMKKLVKGNSYVEVREWDLDKNAYEWRIDLGSSRVEIKGALRVEANGPNACKRINEGEISISIPLVGGKIEKFIKGQTEESFEKGEAFISAYLAANA